MKEIINKLISLGYEVTISYKEDWISVKVFRDNKIVSEMSSNTLEEKEILTYIELAISLGDVQLIGMEQ